MGMNFALVTRCNLLLSSWILRNDHPGTTLAMTTLESWTPEQPPFIHHKHLQTDSPHLRQRQQHDFIVLTF